MTSDVAASSAQAAYLFQFDSTTSRTSRSRIKSHNRRHSRCPAPCRHVPFDTPLPSSPTRPQSTCSRSRSSCPAWRPSPATRTNACVLPTYSLPAPLPCPCTAWRRRQESVCACVSAHMRSLCSPSPRARRDTTLATPRAPPALPLCPATLKRAARPRPLTDCSAAAV